jgi:uncharacterized repeat protein (TIGR03803 family)
MLADRATAQTFTTLYSFSELCGQCIVEGNLDGALPSGELTLSGNTLYGTAVTGGTGGGGTVFAVNTDGPSFTNLQSFANGAWIPLGKLNLSGNTLYGTAGGWLFKVNIDGSGFTNLYNLGGSLRARAGATLFDTTEFSGDSGNGTVFAVNTDATGFTNLHSFTASHRNSFGLYTNSDGAKPYGPLVLSEATLYGTAGSVGSSAAGVVFKLDADGTGFRVLHSFNTADGANPIGLVLSGQTLYGTTSEGGDSGHGSVFKLNTDGSGFTNLHSFSMFGGYVTNSITFFGTNSDGASPNALALSDDTLYGTASSGGSSGGGTVFAVKTDGTEFTTLYSFSAVIGWQIIGSGLLRNSDGASPNGLILSGNHLYGTASQAGIGGNGTVFSLSFTPQLTLKPSGSNVVLTWPTTATGFTLQSTTNLGSPIWTTNLPAPVIINGQNTVTNPISGTQQFFRLSQ